MANWLTFILLLIPIYIVFCLLVSVVIALYKKLTKKKDFVSTFQDVFIYLFLELLNPFNYF